MAADPSATIDPHADAAHGADAAAHGADAAAHGAEAGGAFPPFDASLFSSQLIWFFATFIALYFVVSRFVIPTVGGVLTKRAGAIAGDLDLAAQKSAAADEARASMEKAVAKARADARAMVEAARADVMAKLGAEQEAAEARLAAKIEAAEAKVNEARAKALAEVPALAQNLAREIADKLTPANAPRQRVAGEA
jgi:F-type H+-transporting ATPase subunit b